MDFCQFPVHQGRFYGSYSNPRCTSSSTAGQTLIKPYPFRLELRLLIRRHVPPKINYTDNGHRITFM